MMALKPVSVAASGWGESLKEGEAVATTTLPAGADADQAWDIKGLIKTYPDIAMNMLEELARRLRETGQALSE